MTNCRWMAATAAGLLLFADAAAAARPSESITLLGFSGGGERFGAVVAEPGEPEGKLRTWSAATGAPEDWEPTLVPLGADRRARPGTEALAEYDLGGDPGTERYTSGSAVSTSFVVNGAPVRVEILPAAVGGAAARPTVLVRRGACGKELVTEAAGDLNLVNVLTSRDGGTLAVVLKATEDGVRRHHVAVARLADGELADPGCLDAASSTVTPAAKPAGNPCLDRLRALQGRYAGQEKIKDPAGGEVSLFELKIDASAPAVQLVANPGGGKAVCGAIVGCQQKGGALLVSTRDRSGACAPGSLGIRRLPDGRLEVDYQAYTETFVRR